MKSKYRMCALLILIIYSGSIGAMEVRVPIVEPMEEAEEVVKISQEYKQAWQETCVYWIFSKLLESYLKSCTYSYKFDPLSFELIGSKNFIAYELGKKLDDPELQDVYFKELAEKRNTLFQELKACKKETCKHCDQLWSSHFNSIDASKLLPFIRSLEESIKKRIEAEKRVGEIAWRKARYIWLTPPNGCGRFKSLYKNINDAVEKGLELDIEKEFSLEELQSGDYGLGERSTNICYIGKCLGLDIEEELALLQK